MRITLYLNFLLKNLLLIINYNMYYKIIKYKYVF